MNVLWSFANDIQEAPFLREPMEAFGAVRTGARATRLFCLLAVALLAAGQAGASPASYLDPAALERDRRISWLPPAHASIAASPSVTGASVAPRGVRLSPGQWLLLAPADFETLRRMDLAGRPPAPEVLRVDVTAGDREAVQHFRFDPLATRRALLEQLPDWSREDRLYFAPPPFPGALAHAIRVRQEAGPVTLDCSLARIRRLDERWEELERAAREGFADGLPADSRRLLDTLTAAPHAASESVWRQIALLPWPAERPMPREERELRRAAFFLDALRARAGEPGTMDRERASFVLAERGPCATETSPEGPAPTFESKRGEERATGPPDWLGLPAPSASQEPDAREGEQFAARPDVRYAAAREASRAVSTPPESPESNLELDGVRYRLLPPERSAGAEIAGPRMLRIAHRATLPAASGSRDVRHALHVCVGEQEMTLRELSATADDARGILRDPRGEVLAREQVHHVLVPPGRHAVRISAERALWVELSVERQRQGVGDSAMEAPGPALAAVLEVTATRRDDPRQEERRIVMRATALALLGRLREARETLERAALPSSGACGLLRAELALARGRASEALEASRQAQRPARVPPPAGDADSTLFELALARRAGRLRMAAAAALGRHQEAIDAGRELLELLPRDAATRLELSRALDAAPARRGERSEAWSQADGAWLDGRLDPEARRRLLDAWHHGTYWSELAPWRLGPPGARRSLDRLEPLDPPPDFASRAVELPFRSADTSGIYFPVELEGGLVVEPSASLLMPAATPGSESPASPFGLALLASRPFVPARAPSLTVGGHRPVPRELADWWSYELAVPPGSVRIEGSVPGVLLANVPSETAVRRWSSGRAPLERFALRTYVEIPGERDRPVTFAIPRSELRGALALRVRRGAQPVAPADSSTAESIEREAGGSGEAFAPLLHPGRQEWLGSVARGLAPRRAASGRRSRGTSPRATEADLDGTPAFLHVELGGETRELVLCPGGPEDAPYEAWLPLPPGDLRATVRLAGKGPALFVQALQRLARSAPVDLLIAGPGPVAPAEGPADRRAAAQESGSGHDSLGAALRLAAAGATGRAIRIRADRRSNGIVSEEGPVIEAWLEAVRTLTREISTAAQPASPVWLARGRLLLALGSRGRAEADLRESLARAETASERRHAAEALAEALLTAGETTEALGLIEDAAARDGATPALRRLAATVHLLRREPSRALELLAGTDGPGDRLLRARARNQLGERGLPPFAPSPEPVEGSRGHGGASALSGDGDVKAELDYERAIALALRGRWERASRALAELRPRTRGRLAELVEHRLVELSALPSHGRELVPAREGPAPPAAHSLQDAASERCRLEALRDRWTERSASTRWESPELEDLSRHGPRIGLVRQGGAAMEAFRVGSDDPLEVRVAGPAVVRVSLRADCGPGASGLLSWRILVDGTPLDSGESDPLPASRETAFDGLAGVTPSVSLDRRIELPPGRHSLRLEAPAHPFTARLSILIPAHDDLLAPGGIGDRSGQAHLEIAACALLEARRLQLLGRHGEALRHLGSPDPTSSLDETLVRAASLAGLGETTAARAIVNAVAAGADDRQSIEAARILLALDSAGPGQLRDRALALVLVERVLGRLPGETSASELRDRLLEATRWTPVTGVESAAGSVEVASTGPREAGPLAARTSRALRYSPWDEASTSHLAGTRLELDLEAGGPTLCRLELWTQLAPAATGDDAPRAPDLQVDGELWPAAPLAAGRVSTLDIALESPGRHRVDLGLAPGDTGASAAVRVLLDRPVQARDGALVLGERTPGRLHVVPAAASRLWQVATADEPVELVIAGPLMGRLYVRAVSDGGSPASTSIVLEASAAGGRRTESIALSPGTDRDSSVLDRPGWTLSRDRMEPLLLLDRAPGRLRLHPTGDGIVLVRLEVPWGLEPPAGGASREEAGPWARLAAPGGPSGPSRPMPADPAELLSPEKHRRGTWRYRAAFREALRPEVDDFRLERRSSLEVTHFERSPDGKVTRTLESETRIRVEGPPAELLTYRHTREGGGREGPVLDARALVAAQQVGGRGRVSLRLRATFGPRLELGPRLAHTPEIGFQSFHSSLADPAGIDPAEIDSTLFTRFDRTHSRALFLQDTLTCSPFLDARLYATARAVTNEGLVPTDLDRASLTLGVRRLFGPVSLDASFTRTERFEDADRRRHIRDEDVAIGLDWWHWQSGGRLWIASLDALHRGRFDEWLTGLSVSLLDLGGDGLDDLPPGDVAFRAARDAASPR